MKNQEKFAYFDVLTGSVVFTDIENSEKELATYDELIDDTCVGLEVHENTYIHVAEGICVWEEIIEDSEDVGGGYELVEEVA